MLSQRIGRIVRTTAALALLAVGVLVISPLAVPPAVAAAGPSYVALVPARLLDTRPNNAPGPGGTVDVVVLGRAGVPPSGVAAVFVNVTAVAPSVDGFLTAWPASQTRPNASTLNFATGTTIANGALVRLGANGAISLYVSGATDVLLDVQGYVPTDSAVITMSPLRLLDTRPGTQTVDGQFVGGGRVASQSVTELTVAGRSSIPAGGVAGVFVNIVAVDPDAGGFLTTWPSGLAMPDASTSNYAKGQTIANNAYVGLGGGGKLSLFSYAGTHLIVDIVGYVSVGTAPTPATPARIFDSRLAGHTVDGAGTAGGGIRVGSEVDVVVAGRGGVPSSGVGAVIVNITAVAPAGDGFVTAWATGQTLPTASMLNYRRGTGAIANGTIVPLGDGGRISLYSQAATQVLVDVVGWLPGSFPVPAKLHGINIAPFIGSPTLATTPQLMHELTDRVAPYTEWIRTYQCTGGFDRFATEAHSLGLHLAMGAWLTPDSAGNRREIDCIIAQAKAGNAEVVVIGNETIKKGWLSAAQLTTYLREVKAAVPSSVKVTTAEPDPEWLSHTALFGEVDVVFANIYPFWASSPVEGAVAHLSSTYDILKAAAGGKPITISETGWPTCGASGGGALPSDANAAIYLAGIAAWAKAHNVPYFWLEAYDLAFKSSGPTSVEGCWGIWTPNGLIKPGFRSAFG
jgi:exo-beta-1,3-glucanase (GH17 family)